MKRILISLAAVLALAAPAAVLASSKTTIKTGKTSLGKILEKGNGFTVYVFTADSKNKNNCFSRKSSFGRCRDIWPAVTGKPKAGTGVNATLLGTIKLPNGSRQITYAGHPLYTYSGDGGPGETGYVGCPQFGGKWQAINAKGKLVKGSCAL